MKELFEREVIHFTTGEPVRFIQHSDSMDLVCKPSGEALGFTQNGSTFDMIGRRLMTGENPGLFFRDKKK